MAGHSHRVPAPAACKHDGRGIQNRCKPKPLAGGDAAGFLSITRRKECRREGFDRTQVRHNHPYAWGDIAPPSSNHNRETTRLERVPLFLETRRALRYFIKQLTRFHIRFCRDVTSRKSVEKSRREEQRAQYYSTMFRRARCDCSLALYRGGHGSLHFLYYLLSEAALSRGRRAPCYFSASAPIDKQSPLSVVYAGRNPRSEDEDPSKAPGRLQIP